MGETETETGGRREASGEVARARLRRPWELSVSPPGEAEEAKGGWRRGGGRERWSQQGHWWAWAPKQGRQRSWGGQEKARRGPQEQVPKEAGGWLGRWGEEVTSEDGNPAASKELPEKQGWRQGEKDR